MNPVGASALMDQSPADQVAGETEEQRRKRLQAAQSARQMPGASDLMSAAAGYGSALPPT